MATSTFAPVKLVRWSQQTIRLSFLVLLVANVGACGQGGQLGQKQMRVDVGQIREVSLPAPGDSTVRLIGTSDNSEVVDVSPKQSVANASAPQSDNTIFLIKGVTVGTAKVVFSEKQTGSPGAERVLRTYVVQVSTK